MDKLQWGKRKRLRCVNVKNSVLRDKSTAAANAAGVVRRKISSCFDRQVAITEDTKQAYPPPAPPLQSPHHLSSRDMGMNGSGLNENRTWSSPEKEDRYYTTRGSVGGLTDDNGGKLLFIMESRGEDVIMNRGGGAAAAAVWPKLYTTLSSKEKEEDFMAMKGCKLPQRPKKRAKLVQKTLLLGSPGAWLSDLCQERYEVREKKASKKRPRGLKAMGSRESDSD